MASDQNSGIQSANAPPGRVDTPLWVYLVAIVPAVAVIAFVWLQPWVKPGWLLRDPLFVAATSGKCCRLYYGVVSNFGVLFWCATSAVCLFVSAQLRQRGAPRRHIAFLVYAGLLTGLLLMDDLFFGHESVYPAILGIEEEGIVSAYFLITLVYLYLYRDLILAVDNPLMVLALASFAASVAVDVFLEDTDNWLILVEDGGKFVGISLWATFHIRAAWLLTALADK